MFKIGLYQYFRNILLVLTIDSLNQLQGSREWQQGVTIPADNVQLFGGELIGAVPGLPQGGEYVFRVTAKNENGPSTPSRPSDTTEIEQKPCKWKNYRNISAL